MRGLHLRPGAHGFNRWFMSFLHPRHVLILVLVPLLTACGVVSNSTTIACPSVRVLTLAERLPLGENRQARLTGVSLSCEKNSESGTLSAQLDLRGVAPEGGRDLPVFVASLDSKGQILHRTQHNISVKGGGFSADLPSFAYGKADASESLDRIVVGFVLNAEQQNGNRAAWRKSMGLD